MDVTTIAGASAFQQQQIQTSVQSSVAAKVLDSQKTEGAAIVKMLEAAIPQASSTGSLDIRA